MVIGRVGSPKGVRGDLKIHSYSGEYDHFLKLRTAILEGELPTAAVSRPESGGLRMSAASRKLLARSLPASAPPERRRLRLPVLRAQVQAGGLEMAFAGYESPEAARRLTGLDILAPRSEAAPLRENEWYVGDLVGLALKAEGRELARVESVLEGGPEPWLEARLPGGAKAIVPFRSQFVGAVDLEAGEIELLAPWILE